MLTNCIHDLQTLTPQSILAAAILAVVITALSRLLLVPLALLVSKAPRWFTLVLDVLFVLGAIVLSAPIVYLFAAAGLRRVNPETVLAARTLGMKPGVIRRQVILPQARGWILAGTALCLLRAAIESVVLVIMVANILR